MRAASRASRCKGRTSRPPEVDCEVDSEPLGVLDHVPGAATLAIPERFHLDRAETRHALVSDDAGRLPAMLPIGGMRLGANAEPFGLFGGDLIGSACCAVNDE